MRAAEARLSAAWGERAGVLGAEAMQGRADVFRLRLDGGRPAVLKRRGQDREEGRHGGEAAGFGIELATLEYLNAMPVPVAPRLLGADTEAGIVLMEDLAPGPSLADSLDAYRAEAGAGPNDPGPDWAAAMAAAVASWIIARGTAMATALDEDRPWGTTGMRPRLLAWLRSFTGAAGQAGVLPRLRALARELDAELSSRWPQARVPDFPALARPGALLVQVPDWWRPEG